MANTIGKRAHHICWDLLLQVFTATLRGGVQERGPAEKYPPLFIRARGGFILVGQQRGGKYHLSRPPQWVYTRKGHQGSERSAKNPPLFFTRGDHSRGASAHYSKGVAAFNGVATPLWYSPEAPPCYARGLKGETQQEDGHKRGLPHATQRIVATPHYEGGSWGRHRAPGAKNLLKREQQWCATPPHLGGS